MLSSASGKGKLFAENFSKNSNLDDSGISLPDFPSRTNLKLHSNLDLSKASGHDCIPVVVLKNYEPERYYILAELSNKCLKWSFLPDCGKVSQWSMYLRMLGKGPQLKTTALLVFFLWLVKSLKNL